MNKYHYETLSNKSFLITGGAGFIGSHIVEYLLKNDARKVCVLDNLATGSQENIDMFADYENFEFIEGDIRNSDTCLRACQNIDFVSHQAALGSVPRSVKDPVTSNDVNVGGFINMLTAAKETGVKTFVYASSSSVYGDEAKLPKIEEKVGNPLSPYAVTKKTNELYSKVFSDLYGMNLIGYRYFNVFGPRQDPNGPYAAVIPLFVKGILNSDAVFINGDGEQTRDFTFVDNAVQANIRGMLNKNPNAFDQVYNIAVGENYSINHLYNLIKEILRIEHMPTYREQRQGDIRDSLADISRAKNLLCYNPNISFPVGLVQTVDFFRNSHV